MTANQELDILRPAFKSGLRVYAALGATRTALTADYSYARASIGSFCAALYAG
jgi:hypothetical protein